MKLSIVFVFALLNVSIASAESKRLILESSSLDQIQAELPSLGGKKVRDLERSRGLVVNLSSPAVENLKKKYSDLKVTEDILFSAVGKVTTQARTSTPVQPSQQVPWGITRINARTANALTKGAGVKVCVVDTGIDKTHPDLQANIIGGRNYVVAKGRVDATQYNDDNGHGSHVSGIIAALDNAIGTVGVAPAAKIYAVKALNSRGSGYLSDIADGVAECVRIGAHVINMSLGATQSPSLDSPLRQAVENAVAAGVIVVAAAGNEGESIDMKVPAGYSGVIAVAASDVQDQFPSWSNFGLNSDDVTAPGVSIYSTWKSGSYNTISGTSMASPHVAGVAALKISSQSLGFKTIDLGRSLSVQGAGLIDALATVQNQAAPF